MTKYEALIKAYNYPQSADLVLENQGIDGTAEYSVANKQEIEIASAHLMVLAARNSDVKEGDNQITWRDNLIELANGIFRKYGLTDEIVSNEPQIEILQNIW